MTSTNSKWFSLHGECDRIITRTCRKLNERYSNIQYAHRLIFGSLKKVFIQVKFMINQSPSSFECPKSKLLLLGILSILFLPNSTLKWAINILKCDLSFSFR